MRENTRTRRLLFGVLAVVFIVTGFAWPWLKNWWPPFTAAITSIATNSEMWFILAVVTHAIFIFGVPKARADRAALEARLREMRAEIAAELDAKVSSNLVSAPGESWKADIDRFNFIDGKFSKVEDAFAKLNKKVDDEFTELKNELIEQKRVVANGTRLLIRALRAKDAQRVLAVNDKVVMSLGVQLAKANVIHYLDSAKWLSDYRTWKAALCIIDNLLIEWTKGQSNEHVSFIKFEGRDYENSPMPPDNIRSDDTIIAFKTAALAHSNYANRRDGIFSFFAERAVLPG